MGDTLVYADPFGTLLMGYPPRELDELAKRRVINPVCFQRPTSSTCGYWSALWCDAIEALDSPPKSGGDLAEILWRAVR